MEDAAEKERGGKTEVITISDGDSDMSLSDGEQPAEKIAKIEEPDCSPPPVRCSPEDANQLEETRTGEMIATTKNDELTRDNSCPWGELNEIRTVAETEKDRVAELTLRNHELSSEIAFIRRLVPGVLRLPTPLPDGIPPTHIPSPQFTSPPTHLPTPSLLPHTSPQFTVPTNYPPPQLTSPNLPPPSHMTPSHNQLTSPQLPPPNLLPLTMFFPLSQPSPPPAPANLLPPSPLSLLPPPPPAPLPEDVGELQRQVREWNDKFQEACRIGREAEERAEQASTGMVRTSVMLNNALSREAELKRTISALKEEKEEMRKKMEEMIGKNVSLAQLVKHEGNRQQNFIDQLPMRRSTYLFTIGDPIDLFQLCRPDGPESISLDDALGAVQDKFGECGEEWWKQYCTGTNLDVKLACRVCEKKVIVSKFIPDHFTSQKHVDAVRARGAAVSQPALQHWLRELQLAADAVQQIWAAADAGSNSPTAAAASEDNDQH